MEDRGEARLCSALAPHLRHVLRRVYGFTAAEADVAVRLVAGAAPHRIAEDRAVSVHTVRAQLKSLMAKADVRRRGELIRLLYHAASVLAPGDHATGPSPAPDRDRGSSPAGR